MGARPDKDGISGIQTHMTNTMNTPVEALEFAFPLRLRRYALRRGSGGDGLHKGGDGLIRDVEFLSPARVTVLSERRRYAPPRLPRRTPRPPRRKCPPQGRLRRGPPGRQGNSRRGRRRHTQHPHSRRRRLGRAQT